MRIETRLKRLEAKAPGHGTEVFIYRPIVRPATEGDDGSQTIAISFELNGERYTLKRQDGETVASLEARMRQKVMDLTGARYAFALNEDVLKL